MLQTVTGHFCAAHHLPEYDGECAHLHGHTWKVEVTVHSEMNPRNMMGMDFKVLKRDLNYFLKSYDHSYLNETMKYPTAEVVAGRIFDQMSDIDYSVFSVRVWESDTCSIICRKEDYNAITEQHSSNVETDETNGTGFRRYTGESLENVARIPKSTKASGV